MSAGPAGAGRFYWHVQPCGCQWTADGATGLGVIYPVPSHVYSVTYQQLLSLVQEARLRCAIVEIYRRSAGIRILTKVALYWSSPPCWRVYWRLFLKDRIRSRRTADVSPPQRSAQGLKLPVWMVHRPAFDALSPVSSSSSLRCQSVSQALQSRSSFLFQLSGFCSAFRP